MPILPWTCAHGDAAPVTLACATVVDISPPDDSVDTNSVIVVGTGDILSLGSGPGGFIQKRVVFRPLATLAADRAQPTILLHHNPPDLTLVTGNNRKITNESFGAYVCNDDGHWFELYFTATGAAATENRLAELEARVIELQQQLSDRAAPRSKRRPKSTEE